MPVIYVCPPSSYERRGEKKEMEVTEEERKGKEL
jgi:hypothetical protein